MCINECKQARDAYLTEPCLHDGGKFFLQLARFQWSLFSDDKPLTRLHHFQLKGNASEFEPNGTIRGLSALKLRFGCLLYIRIQSENV